MSKFKLSLNNLERLQVIQFLNIINVDIENAPSLKSTERILRHEYKFKKYEKPWEV